MIYTLQRKKYCDINYREFINYQIKINCLIEKRPCLFESVTLINSINVLPELFI